MFHKDDLFLRKQIFNFGLKKLSLYVYPVILYPPLMSDYRPEAPGVFGMLIEEQSLIEYMYIMLFLGVGFAVAFAPFIAAWMLAPKRKNTGSHETNYECGIEPYGKAWDFRFGVHYYLYALIFLAFDVDILFLFPVATAFHEAEPLRAIVEFIIFVGILSLAIVYAWVKGVFNWQRRNNS